MREVERQKERTFESKSNNKPKDGRTNTETHTHSHIHTPTQNKHTYKIGDLVLFHINTHSNEPKKRVFSRCLEYLNDSTAMHINHQRRQ